MFDLVRSTLPCEDVLKEAENRDLWKVIVSYNVECVGKEDKNAGTERYSSTMQPFLNYMERDIGQV